MYFRAFVANEYCSVLPQAYGNPRSMFGLKPYSPHKARLSTLRPGLWSKRGGYMKSSSLQDLFIIELNDLYDAENQLIKALPKMAKASSSESLRGAFEEHLERTKEHAARIERIFADLDVPPKREKCKGMQGLVSEGNDLLKKKLSPDV